MGEGPRVNRSGPRLEINRRPQADHMKETHTEYVRIQRTEL